MQIVSLNRAYMHVHSPSKVALVIVETPDGKFNPITVEWFMRTSIDPPMIAISIGTTRFSHECLQQSPCFNLCIPSDDLKEEVMFCGSVSGKVIDKLQEIGAEWIPGKLQRLPILKNVAANFECEIVTQVKSGDHTIFVGEVKYAWIDENRKMLLL